MNTHDADYRPGLSGDQLVHEIQSLVAEERTAMRLVCRYLADFVDCIEGRSCAALSCYADVYHAARCLFDIGTHTTRERVRVGRALRSLARIEEALVRGDLSYSRAREVASEASLGEAEALLAVARDALEHQTAGGDTSDLRRAVVLYECQSCGRSELDTEAGAIELDVGAAMALGCGAKVTDLRSEGRIVRAIELAVRLRDRSTCRVPGCQRRRYVDVHPIAPRASRPAPRRPPSNRARRGRLA